MTAPLTPLERVALFFLRRGQTIERIAMPMPGGSTRPALKVGDTLLAVHPKSYVALYRGEKKHGLRERLLRFYAERGHSVAIVELDSGTVAMAEAVEMLDASMGGLIPGAIEGSTEATCFVPRRVFLLFNLDTGASIPNPEALGVAS